MRRGERKRAQESARECEVCPCARAGTESSQFSSSPHNINRVKDHLHEWTEYIPVRRQRTKRSASMGAASSLGSSVASEAPPITPDEPLPLPSPLREADGAGEVKTVVFTSPLLGMELDLRSGAVVVSNVFAGDDESGGESDEKISKEGKCRAEVGDRIVALGFFDHDLHIRVWKSVTSEDVTSRTILRYIQNLPRPLTIAFKRDQEEKGEEGNDEDSTSTPPPASAPATPQATKSAANARRDGHARRKSTGWLRRIFHKAEAEATKQS